MTSSSNSASPANAIEALRQSAVLCVGDVMLDRFIYGKVERISPEAPIPIMHIERESAMPGGAGNVVRNIAGLGSTPHFVTIVGDDDAGSVLESLITETSGAVTRMIRDPGRKTSIKTRYIASSQQLLRADDESLLPPSPSLRNEILVAVGGELDHCAVVILSDYGKGVLKDGLASEIIAEAQKRGRSVIVDPHGLDYEIYRGAYLVTPNLKELSEATKMPVDGDDQVVAACQAVIDNHGIGAVLATRSGDGMTLVEASGAVHHLAAEAQEVFDVSGAGDTVAAAVSAALAANIGLKEAAELANIAAGIVVGKVGTAVAYAEDVVATLRHRDLATGESKILSLQSAVDQCIIWRNQNKTIGFTNGCFDLLHPGHISVLAQSKKACDRLVVGLNSDASTKRLKGDSRPVQSEMSRAAVLASLSSVDLVVIFEEDTPAAVIEALQPAVFVKGADYRIEDIPEAKIVQAYGGKVLLADLEEGHSTTATIARLVK
ncbi:MAG: D-glycero-beta-D-manno-heptose-7-phosphate kinase [Proteobacteria bacterium]|nr:D-glycero-beta-D-manno-heptose-7-phosphate kinase [Pseudomonadota bacterium]